MCQETRNYIVIEARKSKKQREREREREKEREREREREAKKRENADEMIVRTFRPHADCHNRGNFSSTK